MASQRQQMTNSARTTEMEGMMESSIALIEELRLPAVEVEKCHGIVILQAIQAGFFFSAQMGTGIMLRNNKANNTWSAPLAIGLTGVGAGLMMGIEKKNMVIFLNGEQMTKAMSGDFSVRLGIQTSVVLIGGGETLDLTAQVGNKGYALTSAYTSTLGVYCGMEADGAALAPRTAVNEKFYGNKLAPQDIIFGGGMQEVVEDLPPTRREALCHLHASLGELAKPTTDQGYAGTSVDPFLKHTTQMMNGAHQETAQAVRE